jgi:hypothetical protein
MISSKVAPVTARWNLAILRDFFLASDSTYLFIYLYMSL